MRIDVFCAGERRGSQNIGLDGRGAEDGGGDQGGSGGQEQGVHAHRAATASAGVPAGHWLATAESYVSVAAGRSLAGLAPDLGCGSMDLITLLRPPPAASRAQRRRWPGLGGGRGAACPTSTSVIA